MADPELPTFVGLVAGEQTITVTEFVHHCNYDGGGVSDAHIRRIALPPDTTLFAEVFFYTTLAQVSGNDIDFEEGGACAG